MGIYEREQFAPPLEASFQNDGANLKVKYAPSASCECPTFELPCEAAAGESFAQGGDHPSPPSLTPHFPQSPIQRRQGSSPAPAVVSSRGRSRPLLPLRGPQ